MTPHHLIRRRAIQALLAARSPILLPKHRRKSTAHASYSTAAEPLTPLPSRWLSDLKQRIGRCMAFGLNEQQTADAGRVLEQLARDWRELIAGSEGYLTEEGRMGLFRQEVAWGEMDMMNFGCPTKHQGYHTDKHPIRRDEKGHLNNVMYNRYAETGRIKWFRNFATHSDPANRQGWEDLLRPSPLGVILRSIRTDFKFPVTHPDRLTVYHRLVTLSLPASIVLNVLILSERYQRVAARCEEHVILYDYRQGKMAELPAYMQKAFDETMTAQEARKRMWLCRAAELGDRVRSLEKRSWDREGAVEDMGGSDA